VGGGGVGGGGGGGGAGAGGGEGAGGGRGGGGGWVGGAGVGGGRGGWGGGGGGGGCVVFFFPPPTPPHPPPRIPVEDPARAGQADDLLSEIRSGDKKNEAVLVTPSTKRMAEDPHRYLQQPRASMRYICIRKIDAIERVVEISRGLR